MDVLRTRVELRAWLGDYRRKQPDARVAFTPTMGFLHAGHMALLQEAKKRADLSVLSIFVNPLQFNDSSDYEKYPVDLQSDLQLAREARVDLVFAPNREEMYPDPPPQLQLALPALETSMEGAHRPAHFAGVMLVVARLFELVRPDIALFGKKDYQQFCIVKQMARDLDMAVEVLGCETVREEGGLALSSRNARLSPRGREHARLIFRALKIGEKSWREGIRSADELREIVRDVIESGTENRVEYVEIADLESLQPLQRAPDGGGFLLACAVFCEGVRLIDNLEVGGDDLTAPD